MFKVTSSGSLRHAALQAAKRSPSPLERGNRDTLASPGSGQKAGRPTWPECGRWSGGLKSRELADSPWCERSEMKSCQDVDRSLHGVGILSQEAEHSDHPQDI